MAERDDLHQAALQKRAVDFADQQAELGDHNGGKAERFTTATEKARRQRARQGRSTEAGLSLHQRLMLSASYHAAYERLGEVLAKAEQAIAGALSQSAERLVALRQAMEAVRENAARLPDGTRVYRDEEGRIWSEDGRNFDHMGDVIVWPENASGLSDFTGARDAIEAEIENSARLRRIEIDIGEIRDRYEDDENAMTRDEIEAAMEEAQKVSEATGQEMELSNTDPELTQQNSFAIPTMPGS